MASSEGASLERTESYQYPSGHVGHLTINQVDQLEKFKALCTSKKYYTPATESTPASHDDETLLRYLRARKFLPEEAFTQLKDTEDWRKENQLDTLYETIDLEEYEQTRRLYPQWLGRRDKRGIPIYLFEVAHLDSKAVSAYQSSTHSKSQAVTSKVPVKMLRLFALYENLCRFVFPLCSTIPNRPSPETPISQSSNIVDISKVGLKQFWNLKSHMQDASLLATAHYPETLDRIFIIGAPSFFPTVWGWIKRWFDPVTVSKIFILSNATAKSTLLEYIDEENIPKKYGGKLDFKFGDMPMLEPAIADSLEWQQTIKQGASRTIPTGPIKWTRKGDKMTAVAVGTDNGKPRQQEIFSVRPDQKTAQSQLTPGRASAPYLMRTTTGEATHPPTPPQSVTDSKPSDMNDPDSDEGKTEGAHVDETSRAGTYTIPYREPPTQSPAPVKESRQGTSSTRLEQQHDTHARDTMAQGTPNMREGMGGDKHAVMEPGTIGQAPKEVPAPTPQEPQPTMLDTAKSYAGAAYEQATHLPQTVMAAAGYGTKEEEGPMEERKPEDPRVDALEGQRVEEFLRQKNMSQPAPPGSK